MEDEKQREAHHYRYPCFGLIQNVANQAFSEAAGVVSIACIKRAQLFHLLP
jgi:hypothetical protein